MTTGIGSGFVTQSLIQLNGIKSMINSRYEAFGNFYQNCRTINAPFDAAKELKIPLNKLYEMMLKLAIDKQLSIENADNYIFSSIFNRNKMSTKVYIDTESIYMEQPNQILTVKQYAQTQDN
jgi:hypothetical protein